MTRERCAAFNVPASSRSDGRAVHASVRCRWATHIDTVESQVGPIDVLVNSAGAVGPLGHDWAVDGDDWWRTFEVNVGDMFRALLTQGRDTPIDRCAQILLFLVSGRADALSGRFIRVQDNAEDLVHRAEEIQRNDRYTVTLRT